MRRTSLYFMPALLLSLVLGAALAFRLLPLAPPTEARSDERPAVAAADPAAHHTDPTGTGIVVPQGATWGGEANHHSAPARPVAEQLDTRADDVAFCVGSTLEPFDATWAQLRAIGPDEAAERLRRCLMEMVFTHVDPATAADVRAHLPAFSLCYAKVAGLPEPTKGQAVVGITGCLTTLAVRPN